MIHTPTDPELPAMKLAQLVKQYSQTRSHTAQLCEPLVTEDFVVQSMPDASPTRWHLAHTTWFFETFVLAPWEEDYRPAHADYEFLFNSYYNSIGKQFPRPQRGLLTRPTVAEVFRYRRLVDERILRLLESDRAVAIADLARVLELGIHHEQQHQELMLTDLKHLFWCNPLLPMYRERELAESTFFPGTQAWSEFPGGVVEIGYAGGGFAYDNERPRHQVFLQPYEMRNRLVTCGEFLSFIQDDGYQRPELWLSLGWSTVQSQQWTAPFYWFERDGKWWQFTLSGSRAIDVNEPVCHVSYFEADAFARWAGARLPTEAEWESAASDAEMNRATAHFHPQPTCGRENGLSQLHGEVWQWTASAYAAYPGFVPASGALGEYNGKFMCNQYVLRGSSCATPAGHSRSTYRNFFPPEARWQFTGIRLARDGSIARPE